ncbi:HNH endonuclease [Halosimplex salinum]|uniref:HNH endonuclease n=1 Tax=Halosimplex salinum TaxID=1710538 RepID=UPI000F4666C9|nr:HNH endonuclease [Halosimplex salinum]
MRAFLCRSPNATTDVAVCSEVCRREWLSESFTGDGHPNWKGSGNESYGPGWSDVRRRALERDDYQCIRCGATTDDIGRNPDVHHIVPVRRFIESDDHTKTDAHFLENVISLCISCHRKADHGKISKQRLRSRIDSESTTLVDE